MPDSSAVSSPSPIRFPVMPWVLVLVVALPLLATIWAWHVSRTQTQELAASRFENETDDIARAIRERMYDYENALRAGVALFAASDSVTRREWATFFAALSVEKAYPGIHGIGFNERVPAPRLKAHIDRVRADGLADYRVWPEGERAEYFPVTYLEPFNATNQRALGYDVASEPIRRAALDRARDTGQPAVSGRITLVQESDPDKQPGFLMYVPVYRNGARIDSIEDRRSALIGYISGPFRMNELMAGIFASKVPHPTIEIADGTVFSPSTMLFASGGVQAIESSYRPLFERIVALDIGGRIWALRVRTTPRYESSVDWEKPLFVLITGLAASLLLFALTWTIVSDVSGRKRAEAALYEEKDKLQSLVRSAPLAIIALDRKGRVTSWNPYAEKIFGWRESEVVGRPLPTIPDSVKDEFDKVLSEGLHGIPQVARETKRQRKDDTLVDIALWTAPVRNPTGMIVGNIGLLADITERKKTDEALRQSEKKFRDLIEGSIQGVLVSDIDRKPLFANQAFADIFGFTSVDQVLALPNNIVAVAPHEREHLEAMRLARLHNPQAAHEYEFDGIRTDGTIVRVRAKSRTHVWDGKTVVQTSYFDVTALRRHERELTEKSELLETVLENMDQGILVMDPDLRFRLFNLHFLDLNDLPRDTFSTGSYYGDFIRFLARRSWPGRSRRDHPAAHGVLDQSRDLPSGAIPARRPGH